ncbi:Hypothetical predicted protein [Olea europaea subsp. europaea]|uniref:Transmembrane protein n=1 Tax=Olea europaea subsp. europaea TaxID=158383 RepID=A0A8S0UKX6_OLEEU|nr:Hypothetical predicted protein [Olea europaea subsp. europaea]
MRYKFLIFSNTISGNVNIEVLALRHSRSFSIVDAFARRSAVSSIHKDRDNRGFVGVVAFAWGCERRLFSAQLCWPTLLRTVALLRCDEINSNQVWYGVVVGRRWWYGNGSVAGARVGSGDLGGVGEVGSSVLLGMFGGGCSGGIKFVVGFWVIVVAMVVVVMEVATVVVSRTA